MRRLVVLAAITACGNKHAPEPSRAHTAPEVVIEVASPGQGTSEVEQAIAQPIEEVVSTVPGIAHLHTRIEAGAAAVAVELAPGNDPFTVTEAVRARIATVQAQLPPSASLPTIRAASRAGAVLRYTLRTNVARREASHWTDEVANAALERLTGVGRIEVCGTSTPRWTIAADLYALSAHGKTVIDLAIALRGRMLDLVPPVPDQIGDTPLVRDTARMSLEDVPGACRATDHAGDVIAVSVFPQPGADPLAVRDVLEAKLHELVRQLPPGWTLTVLPRTRPIALEVAAPHGVQPIVDALRFVPDVSEYVIELGGREPGLADVRIVPESESDPAIAERRASAVLARQGLEVRARSQWIVQIRGADPGAMRAFAGEVANRLDHPPELRVAGRIGLDDGTRTDLVPDRAKLAELGISMAMFGEALRLLSDGGLDVGTASSSTRVVITVPAPTDLADRLRALELPTSTGAHVPLSELVRTEPTREPSVILRVDRTRWVGVRVAATPEQIHAALDKLATPQGIAWQIVDVE